MTTRQHLIENDCLDRLGWTVHQVAQATEAQMIEALAAHAERKPSTQRGRPPNTEPPDLPTGELDLEALLPLQEILQMKAAYLSTAAQVMPDDAVRLEQSIRSDQAQLDELRAKLEALCTTKRTEMGQRQHVLKLLESTDKRLRREEDVQHMRALREQIAALQQSLQDLNKYRIVTHGGDSDGTK